MSEYSHVEKPILEWLSGNPTDPSDKGLGWTYRAKNDLAVYGRDETDALTEGLLIPALRKINRGITDDNKAKKAVAALRAVMADPDPLSANRRTLDALRGGLPVVLAPGENATTVLFVAFDPAHQGLNDFTVTNQYIVRGSKGTRADTVLLVNGIPLVVCEYKSLLASGHDWPHGVKQVHRYQNEAPQLLVPNVFCVSADEHELRYGAVAYKVESEKDVEAQMAWWQPWLSQYPTTKCYWALPDEEKDEDGVRAAVHGLLSPTNVLSFLEAFVVFETRKGATIKKLARYQQFEAACDIVDRVLDGQHDSGLIWHTQGSGKSLTMLFTAYKLRRLAELRNPTVFIVVDRSDLKTQIADEFDDCDYPSVSKAMGVRDLKGKITADSRETIVTTVQCFQQMDSLTPNTRHNIILLIDEAHRSQKGKEAGYAMTMRAKLPNAFRFGLTGTPIDRTMNNTHRNFGPVINGEQERYLSYYGIRQAIADGATLPVHYEMHIVPIKVDKEALNISFEQMCADMEVLDDEEKTELQAREARWKALVKDERRIQTVIEHMVSHFLAHPDPNGFKAQLVCVDREACALYKAALDKELVKHGKPAAWSEVVISPSQNDTDQLKRFHYDKSATEKIIERFKHRPDQEVAGEVPLKILIVCDRLLTGFDAPVEQVMYLDKPLRDHNLLQAMARTNRPLPQMDKINGLIIDYFGVFADLQKALNFDEKVREEAVIDWDRLKEQVPIEIGKCLAPFFGIPMDDSRDCLLACLRRLNDQKTAQDFETQFKRTQALWEALSPDECLYEYRRQYAWLCAMYIAHRRRNRRAQASHEELAAKTRELIQTHTEFLAMATEVPVYQIDEKYVTRVRELPTAADRAAELESALTAELIEGGGGVYVYKMLGERLKAAIKQKEQGDVVAQKLLEQLAEDVQAIKSEPQRLGLNVAEYALFAVIRDFAPESTEEAACVQAARTMVKGLKEKKYLPSGWSTNKGGRNQVTLTLQITSWEPGIQELNLCPTDSEAPPFLSVAVEELSKVNP